MLPQRCCQRCWPPSPPTPRRSAPLTDASMLAPPVTVVVQAPVVVKWIPGSGRRRATAPAATKGTRVGHRPADRPKDQVARMRGITSSRHVPMQRRWIRSRTSWIRGGAVRIRRRTCCTSGSAWWVFGWARARRMIQCGRPSMSWGRRGSLPRRLRRRIRPWLPGRYGRICGPRSRRRARRRLRISRLRSTRDWGWVALM